MNSLGWEQCGWCFEFEYNMYIKDWPSEIMYGTPLCGDCLFRDPFQPPHPSNLDRYQQSLMILCRNNSALALEVVSRIVADFVRDPMVPGGFAGQVICEYLHCAER